MPILSGSSSITSTICRTSTTISSGGRYAVSGMRSGSSRSMTGTFLAAKNKKSAVLLSRVERNLRTALFLSIFGYRWDFQQFESPNTPFKGLWHPWKNNRFFGPSKARKRLMPLAFWPVASLVERIGGGQGGIRTHEPLARLPDFECCTSNGL